MPWELGLAETQQSLVDSHLRSRVRVRVDGGFLTGRQVIVAALLGADEYSFGTAAMIAEGCIMLRACHRDTCKPGIATQRPNLRANFTGTPEGVAAFMLFVAEEVRGYLAELGFRNLDEAIGQVSCLRQGATVTPGPMPWTSDRSSSSRARSASPGGSSPRADPVTPLGARGPRRGRRLPCRVGRGGRRPRVPDRQRRPLDRGGSRRGHRPRVRGPLTRGTARIRFVGSAGQSFGAFLTCGVELHLAGEANDYVGKAMGGGRIVITPPADDAGAPVLAGNTCLYGATGGEVFIAGEAGERFAVRNSGATGRGRGRRRPLLRVHDRWHRGRPRSRRAQRRCGHDRR
jgi:glutamate synthase (ferredoxin)